jgi:hypothetical protein
MNLNFTFLSEGIIFILQIISIYSKGTRTYDTATLRNAVSAVKERKLTISQAPSEFSDPRKTIGK